MTYIIIKYSTPDGKKHTDFQPLGDLDFLEDREWALDQAVKEGRSREASGCVINCVYLAEVV